MGMEYEIDRTKKFDKWLKKLKETEAKLTILARIDRVKIGHFGDQKQLEENFFEIRLFTGPGYRIYYTIRGGKIVLLLLAGDKSSQKKDIKKAKELIKKLE
ncbi:type II toxin-antitoxin system RelE/ParE family toxin [Desulfotalea psychrophila]|uniref:Addiction module killer protein n=1 Tax=Desulfotalea psychrophila (strain LSv54 / DSM 12343) TaxID=177439 RepID=Q6ALJ1_DESPS|nr:type II toxin-antitoxin system RelE/ParE family toxin [Desulfotalea psychrophila]CAG36784.1 hypothetical protein DP2055 [Desulfotalea psychrophila LSv54]